MSTLAYIRPVTFELDGHDDRFLFSDAFIVENASGRNLVLITTYYPDLDFDFINAVVSLNGVRLNIFDDVGRDEHEPMRAIVYPLNALPQRAQHELEVRYQGQRFNARLSVERPPDEPVFGLATLFKDDFDAIETCYHHYKRQGVERFFFFYNGKLSRLPALFSAPSIVYGEWNFRYWIDSGSRQHHAQAMFLTMVRFKFLAQCSYLALVDLDEFLAVPGRPGMTVRDYVEHVDAESLTARCFWSEVRPANNAARQRAAGPTPKIAFADLEHVWANRNHEGDARMKTIYRGDFDGLCGVHRPKRPADTEISEDLALYHLVNTSHGRYNLMAADAAPVTLR